jgi:oligopeptidase B
MNNSVKITVLTVVLILNSNCNNTPMETVQLTPPKPKKIPKELTIHNDTRIDNYYWLQERENPEVIEYLKAENQYTEKYLEPTKPLQEKLFKEITSRIKQNDESVPYKENGYIYITKYEEGKEYPIYYRKKDIPNAKEELLLDVNKLAEGRDYYDLGDWDVSPDNKLLAYTEDIVSRRLYTLKILNLETGEYYPETIRNISSGISWANDNKTIFYTKKDTVTLRTNKVAKHILNTPVKSDKIIFEENDETFYAFQWKSKSNQYIFVGSGSTLTTEMHYLDANNPEAPLKTIQPRTKGVEYYVAHLGDYFYIRTNYEAQNFRLMRTSIHNTSIENWEEVVPNRKETLLEEVELFKNYIVLSERSNGLTHIRILNPEKNIDYYLPIKEETYTLYIDHNPEFNTTKLRYGYTSLTTPNSTYEFDMETKQNVLLKQYEVQGGYNPDEYQAKRIWATAEDGTKIPISLVYKKTTPINGTAPCIIYGYGSYGSSMDVYFSLSRLSLLNRGFVYAIAHIRGGEEMGRQWYEEGKLLKKKNTFTDFIACSETLIKEKYSAPDKLFAWGGSAGGLLVGAVANMRPDLYRGIIAEVPFVDVVTTMLDESIPLTTGEFDEWGNPKDSTYYFYMKSYSPYDNVKKQPYPAMLVTTGLYDSQVQYWEPAKWVAKLREYNTSDKPILLYVNMDAGHGGASGRFAPYKEIAMQYAFIFYELGIND